MRHAKPPVVAVKERNLEDTRRPLREDRGVEVEEGQMVQPSSDHASTLPKTQPLVPMLGGSVELVTRLIEGLLYARR